MVDLRWYQAETIDAVEQYLQSTDTHGVVALPTAAGKTIIFASMIRRWMHAWPGQCRVCILAHREELLTQAEQKIHKVWPGAPTGVYSASLKRRETNEDITIAGIASVHKRADEFRPFDVIIIDEAHLVPHAKGTMYRRFLDEAWKRNPDIRFIGFTATPYRMDGGHLCGEGKMFRDVIYEADIGRLIADGFLCNLRTKGAVNKIDTTGLKIRNGDFVESELQARAIAGNLVAQSVDEIIRYGHDRKAWLIFCAGVDHAYAVSAELGKRGFNMPVVVGETDKDLRRDILSRFDTGTLRGVVNCNCLTTGLDVTRIDLIAMLRPTASTSLWVQSVGRGFRLHPEKADCLVLDFGGNCKRHGPLDRLVIRTKGKGEAPVKECPQCHEMIPLAAMECPECGHVWEDTEKDRSPKHDPTATDRPILGTDPWEFKVESVTVVRHQKVGSLIPLLRVTYFGLFDKVSEWICLEHPGYPGRKARKWWFERFGLPIPESVDEALGDMFLGAKIKGITRSVKVRQVGKYTEVVSIDFDSAARLAVAH